ncbi:hypothetical protein [Cylindrospermum sp. FACHB-282]|uniref:hypothetical protein n=1 Tax=Cylindrospermum sp. FACHB-282 TaxID=2692794 RepID=UPI001687AE38|nr:hypothetical protein [Cylindrospermum sp. FACHB-282]MBD2384989.1 hypothetical protein [Cylindrospermum sp. FACHB-282]
MNRIFAWLQNTILRQFMIVCLVGFAFFGMQALNSSNTILLAEAQIQETVKTPEGIYYKGTPDNRATINDNQVENAQNRLKETTKDVRDKLNLDEEIPESTKQFLDSAQTKVEEAVEPITGRRHGYYQENIPQTGTTDRR